MRGRGRWVSWLLSFSYFPLVASFSPKSPLRLFRHSLSSWNLLCRCFSFILFSIDLFSEHRLSLKPVLNWANFCFANLVQGIRRTATKLCSGSKKLRSTCSGNSYSLSSANLASDWLRAKRALLWMRNK